jgi:hypothetical protein
MQLLGALVSACFDWRFPCGAASAALLSWFAHLKFANASSSSSQVECLCNHNVLIESI